ncbi:MAG: NAD(P)/FAD-dependent oxidoreductase [Clostridium sp.]|nr:NAD(P)/FAD-dependent oxidoreductase [Clostridium sp.]
MDVAIIGGGAAGFFMAVNLKRQCPHFHITIFEKQRRVLAKVAVSGGGRCNLTNSFEEVKDLKNVYPRGHQLLKRLFRSFGPGDAYRWFEEYGVPLVTQDDHCVFPQSQDAQSIIHCLTEQAHKLGVEVRTCHTTNRITRRESPDGRHLQLEFAEENHRPQAFHCVAITTGGSPRSEGLRHLEALGHIIAPPVPSLFTFNVKDKVFCSLMGTVAEPVITSIPGTKFRATGPLLITHWGASGPAILKLSSHAARYINEHDYHFPLLINWTGTVNTDTVAEELNRLTTTNPHRLLSNLRPYNLPTRLWNYLTDKAGLPTERKWGELGKKGINRLVNILCNDAYEVNGKGAFREEFVTCGGISLDSVDCHTLESKTCPGLYFAGEVLDIDGVTGGFNFQAAWTTGWTVAQAIARTAAEIES